MYDTYSNYGAAGYDKRQRTDSLNMLAAGYSVPMSAVSPGSADIQNYQMQMNISSCLMTMYTDIQTIKYDITVLSQNIASLKTTITSMKSGIDALCTRHGLTVPSPNISFQ